MRKMRTMQGKSKLKQVKVYIMNISAINPHDGKWRRLLSPRRAEKVNRLKQDNKKAQSIGVELLLRRALRDITGRNETVVWDTNENGKPYLTDYPEIHINFSHSGDYAACAVSNAPVGIDLQHCDEKKRLMYKCFAEDEVNYIKNSPDKLSVFYELWTKKESLLKACGKGITVPLKSFSVLQDTVTYEGIAYKFKEYKMPEKDYRLFVCSPS